MGKINVYVHFNSKIPDSLYHLFFLKQSVETKWEVSSYFAHAA